MDVHEYAVEEGSPTPIISPIRASATGRQPSLRLDAHTFRLLLERLGPSLALWRAAEVAALREQDYERPILDLGCGDGLVTSLVLPRVDIGLDPDERALVLASGLHLYERFEPVAAESMQVPAASIGTVVSNSVLEHLPRLDAVLAATARVLRPGGRLIFTAPTEAFSGYLALSLPSYAAWRNGQLAHLNLWSVQRWAEHLDRAGLRIEEMRPYLRPHLVRLWDALELTQQVWIARRRLVSLLWKNVPPAAMDRLANRGAQLELSSPDPGGGRLIVARKR